MGVSVSWSESVVPVALAWAGSAWLLVALAVRTRHTWRRAAGREDGVDYTVNLVVTVPLLAIGVVFAIETTLLLSTKLATAYAAYAAARSARVWEPYGPAQVARKAHQAAALALAPFSRGLVAPPGRPGPSEREGAAAYRGLYARAVGGPVRPAFLENQYLRARAATSVTILPAGGAGPAARLTAVVTYRYPFRFRAVARSLADGVDPTSGEAYRTVTTTVSLPRQEELDDPKVLGPLAPPGS